MRLKFMPRSRLHGQDAERNVCPRPVNMGPPGSGRETATIRPIASASLLSCLRVGQLSTSAINCTFFLQRLHQV
jgi:hypothetical protein